MNENQNNHGTPVPPPPHYTPQPQPPGHGKAVASLVLGICSIVFQWGIILGLGLGIVAIIMAISARNEGYVGGLATGGLITGIIGAVFGGLWFISCMSCIACMPWYMW